MPIILSGIHTLDQHLSTLLDNASDYRPKCCASCGTRKLWFHGFYTRKAACEKGRGNPAMIPRFLCPHCGQTCSVLPEYIPPKRWYHWAVQQVVWCLLLNGCTYRGVLDALSDNPSDAKHSPKLSISTLHRWWSRVKSDYLISRFCLCNHFPSLGVTDALSTFWSNCLGMMRLSSAMTLLFNAESSREITLHY